MADETSTEAPRRGVLARVRGPWLLLIAAVVLGVGGFFVWRQISPRESTDDAQVSGHVTPVSARVSGTVVSVPAADNQMVNANDVLVELDRHDYQLAVDRAQADLAAAEASAQAARTSVPITTTTSGSQLHVAQAASSSAEAGEQAAAREIDASKAKLRVSQAHLAEATATATRARQDLERLKPLLAKDEIPRQQYDAAVAAQQSADAAVDSANASIAEAQSNISVAEARHGQSAGAMAQARAEAQGASTAPQQIALTQARAQTAEAQVLQMRAALNEATLNLERTKIRAPTRGVVSRKTIEVGQVIQSGQPLLALTSLDDVWVVANFKETQLQRMRTGQRTEVSVDTYDRTLSGHVESIAPATGATFSLLPPENATGNFVKVVQRIPVKIAIDSGQTGGSPLRPGMSATVTVYTK